MKTYKINYDCENCGCETCKSYNKGILAPATVKCDNCGCKAFKIGTVIKEKEISVEPTGPNPYKSWEKDYPWKSKDYPNPWKDYPKIMMNSPFQFEKIMDGGFPQPSYNDNILKDGHWILCQSPLKKGM